MSSAVIRKSMVPARPVGHASFPLFRYNRGAYYHRRVSRFTVGEIRRPDREPVSLNVPRLSSSADYTLSSLSVSTRRLSSGVVKLTAHRQTYTHSRPTYKARRPAADGDDPLCRAAVYCSWVATVFPCVFVMQIRRRRFSHLSIQSFHLEKCS